MQPVAAVALRYGAYSLLVRVLKRCEVKALLMTRLTMLPAASGDNSAPATDRVRALFHVTGTADAGLLPRIVEPVAKLGLVPRRLHVSAEDGDGSQINVDLRLVGVGRTQAERVALALRRVVGVHQVLSVIEDDC